MVSRLDRPNPPCVKKERNFKEVLIFSADFFTRSFQQIFSADLRSRFSSADVLSRSSQQIFSQQIFSADLLSRFFQQIFSADLLSRFSLSRFSQQIFSADFLSRSSQQIFSADFLSRSSQQIFSADLLIVLSFAVVRGCHLLWSGVGGQLLSYHLLWSGVGGQLLSYHVGGLYCMSSLEGPFRGAFGNKWSKPLPKIIDSLIPRVPTLHKAHQKAPDLLFTLFCCTPPRLEGGTIKLAFFFTRSVFLVDTWTKIFGIGVPEIGFRSDLFA